MVFVVISCQVPSSNSQPPALKAAFTYTPATPVVGQAEQFTDASVGSPTSWQWNFGDSGTSTAQNPSHAFTTAGSYTVTLTVTNASGSKSTDQTLTVVAGLTAAFTYSPASPLTGQAVQFTDTSTGSPTSWQWNFGDLSSSAAQNPSHAFTTAGSYTVTLTITNASSSKSTNRTLTVVAGLKAAFAYTPASPAPGQAVQFTDTSTGTASSWQWSFGDGATSTTKNPSHTFSSAGAYTVTLTVSDGTKSDSASRAITVATAPPGYYVDGSNPNASDSNPGTEALPWKTITKASRTLVAGDTVYIKAGTYGGITGSAIDPVNTGTAGNIITFTSYNNDDVQIVGSGTSSMAVDLDSDSGTVRSYIKVQGLHFTNFMRHLWIRKGSHNEISHCSFIGFPAGATLSNFQGTWSASYIYRQATYNWIHHCTFGDWGICEPYGTDVGVVFQVGLETSTTDKTQYNLIEDNEFYHGGHHVISFNGSKNVYRNNYCHNEPWYPIGAPVYSTRTMFQTGAPGDGCYNLVEGNRIGYGGPKNKAEIGGAGGTMAGAHNIWRKNVFLQIYTDGMWVTKYSGQTDVTQNHVYNNTFWHGGYGSAQRGISNWDNAYTHPICIAESADGSAVYDNVFKNNIFYQNNDLLGTSLSVISYSTHRAPTHQIVSNNWLDNAGDPKFADISGIPDPMNKDQFDFTLQASSPCISAGGPLTTITSASGSGTVFNVADAGYFMDGWGIPGVNGDEIQILGTSQKARITNVNYDTNTITVDVILMWAQGQGIALAYVGSAPDLGALEYGSQAAPVIK